MSSYSQTLTSHGDLLANIPGILGFYPQDSLVLAFFERGDDTHSLHLGPLARLDIDGAVQQLTEDREKFTAWTQSLDLNAVTAYVVTEDMGEADAVTQFLCSEDSPLPNLLAVVLTAEITTGEPWWAAYRHPGSDERRVGVINSVATSVATRHMVEHTGELPELDRQQLMGRLNSTAHGITQDTHGTIIEDALAYLPPLFRDLQQREYEYAAAGTTDPKDTRAIRSALKCFTIPRLRDPLLAHLLEEPQAGLKFAEQLMRTVPLSWPGMRAQLTATVALTAQATGQTGLATLAAHRAAELGPEESFPALVDQAANLGVLDKAVDTALSGGREARVRLFED